MLSRQVSGWRSKILISQRARVHLYQSRDPRPELQTQLLRCNVHNSHRRTKRDSCIDRCSRSVQGVREQIITGSEIISHSVTVSSKSNSRPAHQRPTSTVVSVWADCFDSIGEGRLDVRT